MGIWQRRVMTAAPLVFLAALWVGLTETGTVDPVFLPGPAETLAGFRKLLTVDFLQGHLWPSIVRVGGAFLFSTLVAFPLGIMTARVDWMARVIHPLCGFTRYLPVAALVPLCILWFGIDDLQKMAVITIGLVFQQVLLFADDARTVPGDLVEAGRTFGLSEFEIIRRIVLPWAMPAIWDDMRIAAGWAWSYLVLAELVAGNKGIGYFVIQSQRYLETDRVFAGILFIGLLGLLTDRMFKLGAGRMFRWQ